jgi:hypothetical protein
LFSGNASHGVVILFFNSNSVNIKTKQNKTKQNKTKQNKTKQNKTKQEKRRKRLIEVGRLTCASKI